MANNIRQEEMWDMIVNALREAERAAIWSFWRDRFNANHLEQVQKIANSSQYATAKALYCANREYLDKVYAERTSGLGPTNKSENQLFDAMRQVVDNEAAEQLEKMLTEEETVKTKWENDDYLVDEEELEDEDEQYVRETSDSYEDESETNFEDEVEVGSYDEDYEEDLDEEF